MTSQISCEVYPRPMISHTVPPTIVILGSAAAAPSLLVPVVPGHCRGAAITALLAILHFVLSSCAAVAPAARDPAVLVRVAEDEAKGLDPQSVSDLASLRIAVDQFEGLTRFGSSGQAEPALAQAWTVSPDGLAWRFTLRPALRFSDGTPITAATFAATYDRLIDPATSSPVAALFEAIATVTADNRDTVTVTLKHPFPALPELLAHPAMAALPLHRARWTADRPVVASGAYRLTRWALSDHIELAANPLWHGGTPRITAVEWRPVTDMLASLRMYEAAAVDTVGDIPSARLAAIKASRPGEVQIAPYRGVYYFAFNTRQAPFDDARVRLALSLAVERDWLATKLLATGVQAAWGVIPPDTTGLMPYRPAWSDWPRARRLAVARVLMQRAGYSKTRPLVFDIRFNSDIDHRRIAVALAAFWQTLGVEVHLLNSEAALHFASLRRGDFALARSGWIGDLSVPENFLGVHHSHGGAINYSGFASNRYDRALDAALLIADPEKRAAKMRAAETILMAASPVLPLYYYVSKSLVAPRVRGWRDNPANMHPSRTLRLAAP